MLIENIMACFRWLVVLLFLSTTAALAQPVQASAVGSNSATLSSYVRRLDLIGVIPQNPASEMQDVMVQQNAGRKSAGLAALYSLLLPGMGELYAGGFNSGKYFLAAEGALWITYAAFEIRGDQLQSDARSFAAAHAGFQAAGKDDQFFVDVSNFSNTEDFNEKVLRDRNVDRLYDRAAGYGWQWDSEASRMAFKDQRIASDNAFNNRKFVVAAILINHIGSAINAARSAVAHNNALAQALDGLDLHARMVGGTPVYSLSLCKTF